MADSATTPAVKNIVELEADVNVEFNEATSRQQINSGESVKTLFGKLRKFLADLKAVAFTGSYADLSDKPVSLPANGGNADTVDGLHADGFIKVNGYDGYDCNTLYDAGLYLCSGQATNTPNDLKYGSLFVMPYRKPYGNLGPDYCAQIFIPNGDVVDASMWYRTSLQNTWNEWKRSCDGGNADTVDGYHASDLYSSANKPYVSGTAGGWDVPSSGSTVINIIGLGFTPSAVICVFNNGVSTFANPVYDGFDLTITSTSGNWTTYIAFK